MSTFLSLSKAMLLGFVRDKAAMFFTILFPLMFLVLFGGIFSSDVSQQVRIAQIGDVPLFDNLSDQQREQFEKVIDIEKMDDRAEAIQKVEDGDLDAAVEARGNQIIEYFSAADAVTAGTVSGVLRSLVQETNIEAAGVDPQYSLVTTQVEDESLKPIQYIAPGILGWAVSMGATFGAGLTLVAWRRKKVLRRLRLAPVGIAPIVGARIGVSLMVALVQAALFLLIASMPYFGLQLSDQWWWSIPLILLGAVSFMSVGLLVGAWAKTEESASAMANLIILPMAFLSGSLIPLNVSPEWMQQIAKVLPMYYLTDGVQAVIVRGEGVEAIMFPALVLVMFSVVIGFIATRVFRWDDV